MAHKRRVAIIGGGLFGITAALALGDEWDIHVYEKSADILRGATYANHGRQHLGFHYPRSIATARQCQESIADFRSWYGEAERSDFPSYYCVAKEGSRLTGKQYLEFCREASLAVREIKNPVDGLANERLELVIETDEGVIDYNRLRSVISSQLSKSLVISVHLNSEVMSGTTTANGLKRLTIRRPGDPTQTLDFDCIISAAYAGHNSFCSWFGFEPKDLQFNLQELCIVELPKGNPTSGFTIVDGSFPSLIPMGRTGYHLLAHVTQSQLVRETSKASVPLLSRAGFLESNWSGVLEASVNWLPVLVHARYLRSLFVDRVVETNAFGTDARLTDITDHGGGCYSIFAAKVVTCVSTGHKLAALINASI